MKSVAMVIAIIPLLCLIVCVLLYALNHKNYYHLLDKMQKEYILPTFYAYHSNMGFIGAPVMAFFFLRLQRKKKLPFLERESVIYGFPEKNHNLINKLVPFYYTFMTGIIFSLVIFFISLVIKIYFLS